MSYPKLNRIENHFSVGILQLKKRRKSCCDSFSAESAEAAAEAVSSSVGRCIHTNYLLVVVIVVIVVIVVLVFVVVAICFMIFVVATATIIHLMDCLYDGFMDRKSKRIAEESSSAAEATAATAAKAATSAEESSSAAEATAAEATPCQCALFRYSIYHRR